MNRRLLWALSLGAVCVVTIEAAAQARAGTRPTIVSPRLPEVGRDSVATVANGRYGASEVHQWALGANYRDLWGTTIKVPVLDIDKFAGGLRATEVGGGAQTRSLRLQAPHGRQFTFRPLRKDKLEQLDDWEGTIVFDLFKDGLSASFPAAPVVAAPFHAAAGLLHAPPVLVVLPDHERLGEYRQEFAGTLGTIEEHPQDDDETARFAGALDIEDSEDLLKRLNADPTERIDTRAFLTARLLDLYLNDNDRHPGQWKWARFAPASPWVPIPRDRDKVFVSHEGTLLALARIFVPKLVTFDDAFPRPQVLFENAVEFDRRLLATVDAAGWDSVAQALSRRMTDSVITAALRALPPEYGSVAPELTAKLRARREHLSAAALKYYRFLWRTADLHGTDTSEQAEVIRLANGHVRVRLTTTAGQPFLDRDFDPEVTKAIRIYLHGGDDRAIVRGQADRSIPVWIIGGNGNNVLVDSSTVSGRAGPTKLYDRGRVENIRYSVEGVDYDGDTAFNRLPLIQAYGKWAEPHRDYGTRIQPVLDYGSGHGLGFVPKVGFRRYQYGFRTVPYASMVGAQVEYATGTGGWRIGAVHERRFESSQLMLRTEALMSQLEIIRFRGFGNDIPDSDDPFYDVDQRQWMLHPAAGYALGEESALTVGPIVKMVETKRHPFNFISEEDPYGTGHFQQAGLRLAFRHDARDDQANPRSGFTVAAAATGYVAGMDVREPFADISAVATAYMPLPRRAVLAVRAGGKKVNGDFPYFEAAFIGGSRSVRTFHNQQFAGDASLFGSAELRVPLARVAYLLPFDIGAIGFVDAGRVYMDGASPGGWHSVAGAGVWLGVLSPATGLSISVTSRSEQRLLIGTGVSF